MSKYADLGAYHYKEFSTPGSSYREHVIDVVRYVSEVVDRGRSVIDFGCGEGLVTTLLYAAGFEPIGIEIDKDACQLASSFGVMYYNDFSGFEGEFAAVLMLDVLEHVADLHEVIDRAADHIESEGFAFVAVPDRHDKHAIRQNVYEDVHYRLAKMHSMDRVHYERRHARHFAIFQK